jgi:hypothetical protein
MRGVLRPRALIGFRVPPPVRFYVPSAPLLVALIVAVGCGGTRTVATTPTAKAPGVAQPKGKAREYPAEVQQNIIVGCTHGATESQCKCVLRKLEAHYTLAQLRAIEQGMAAKVTPPAGFTKIASECKH